MLLREKKDDVDLKKNILIFQIMSDTKKRGRGRPSKATILEEDLDEEQPIAPKKAKAPPKKKKAPVKTDGK